MPVLSQVGRRSPGQLVVRTAFYALLCSGALAIVYPLALVVGQAVSDRFDLRDNALLPRYLSDRNELALKHVFSHSRKLTFLASRHHRDQWTTQPNMRADVHFLRDLAELIREQGFGSAAYRAVLRDFGDFKRTLEPGSVLAKAFRVEDHYRPFLNARFTAKAQALRRALAQGGPEPPWLGRAFPDPRRRAAILRSQARLARAILNHEFGSDYATFHAVEVMPEGNLTVPVWRPKRDAKSAMWREFLHSLPDGSTWVPNSDAYWHDYLRVRYNDKIGDLNLAWASTHRGFFEIRFPFSPPANAAVCADWERFVLKRWPRRLLALPRTYASPWRRFLRERLTARHAGAQAVSDATLLAELNRLAGTRYADWDHVPLPETWPEAKPFDRFWAEFSSSGIVPARAVVLRAPELQFQKFLTERYGRGRPGGRRRPFALSRPAEPSGSLLSAGHAEYSQA